MTGVVKTQDGDPIPGATVMVVGTNEGVDTQEDGTYSLVAKKGDRLKVIFEGYRVVTVTVGDSNILNVNLQEEEVEMTGIIIDQYRTMNSQETTVAQTTITSKTIEGRPNANVIQTLQGQVPGLNIMTGSGQPGSDNINIVLRGVGSINGSTAPLFVVDGVAMSDDRFRSINPNDIETISVLKDAGATAIYGNRGANGVIVITTKRGGFDQDLTIKYSGLTGMQYLQDNKYNLLDGSGLRALEKHLYSGYGGAIGRNWTAAQIANSPNTDWENIFFRPAIQQNHTLSFSLGSKNLASSTSIGYADYEGVLQGTNMSRFNLRSNLNGKNNNGRLNYSTSLGLNYSKNKMLSSAGSNNIYHNYFQGAFRGRPDIDPNEYNWGRTFEDTERAYAATGGSGAESPIVLLNRRMNVGYQQNELKMTINGGINYKLTDDITIGNVSGVDYQTINQPQWYSPNTWSEIKSVEGILYQGEQIYGGYYGEAIEQRFVFNSTTSLKYAKTFDEKHSVSAGLFTEYLKGHLNSSSLSKSGFDPIFWSPGAGTGWLADVADNDYYAATAGKTKFNSGLFSYFATATYDYDRRFGLDATIRRDASFRFTKDNQWGTFWSVAGRWNIANEEWMKNSVFTDLKIRGSYGTSGNQDILGTGLFGGGNLFSTLYSSGTGYLSRPSLNISQLPNIDLQWETTVQSNIGLDFGVFNNRLRGNFDVYEKTTEDLFLSKLMSAINATSSLPANFGTMRNRGIEVLLEGDIIKTENTRVTLRANGSYNQNKIVDIPEESGFFWDGGLTGYKEGGAFNEFYMFKYAGVDAATGRPQFYAKDGSLVETPTDDDRHWSGKTMWPKYQGSFGIDVEHKGLFFTANFTFAKDIWRYDNDYLWYTNPGFVGDFNVSGDLYDVWTNNNKGGSMPSMTASNLSYLNNSDFYLKDASYIRLRFVTLGYNFKQKDLQFLKLSGLRIFAQGENLMTWTNWKGWDAESSRGVDLGQYPTPRSVSFGVEVQF